MTYRCSVYSPRGKASLLVINETPLFPHCDLSFRTQYLWRKVARLKLCSSIGMV
jgi:hypothetical protein